jgi:opacity protein-like surface antigen
MKKFKLIALIVFSLLTANVYSQVQFGLQVGPQFPLGDFSSGYNMGFGFSANGKYFLSDDVAVGLNFGYNHFGTDYKDVNCGLMPMTLLAEYHLSTGDIQPVLGFDIGAYNVTVNVLGIKSSDLQFGLAPYAGLQYHLSDNFALTGALKWNYVMTKNSDFDWLGVNLGIVFGL